MKRIVAIVAAAGLVLSACGGGDDDADDAGSEPTTEASEEPADEPSGEPEPADEPSDEADGGTDDADDAESDTGTAGDAAPADDGDDTTDDGGDTGGDDAQDDAGTDDSESDDADSGGSGPVIRSIDDVPEECRQEMAEFLREVEPIVSPIDWQNATLADFESIAADFEAQSDLFDERSSTSGCNDLRFADNDDGLDLMIEFAGSEAPGTVGFLEFLNGLQGNFPVDTGGGGDDGGGDDAGGDDGGGDDPGGNDGFETCAEAVDFVQSLIDTYDSFSDVPAAQLLQFSNLSTVFITCTPSELEFFDSDEFNDFFGS